MDPSFSSQTKAELAAIYQQHIHTVWRALASFGVPAAYREDAAHEVFLIAARRLKDFDRQKSMRAWLFGISRNVAMHEARSRARRDARHQRVPDPPEPVAPDDWMAQVQAASVLQGFLDGLEASWRAIFVMADVEGMTGREIAEALDLKQATVHSRLRTLRAKFADYAQTNAPAQKPS